MNALSFFPSRRITLYMARLFLVRTAAILALLVIVLQALDLLSESGNILAVPGNGQAQVLAYVGMRAPEIVARFLPFSVLLGTLVTLATLNQNSEIIAMKAAGLSAHQVLAPLVAAAVGVAAISFAFNETVVVQGSARLKSWKEAEYHPLPPDTGVRTNVWVKQGGSFIRAGRVFTGKDMNARPRLEDVDIYGLAGDSLGSIVHGRLAEPRRNGWLLRHVTRFEVASARLFSLPDQLIGADVPPQAFTLGSIDPEGLAPGPLRRAIDSLQAAGKRTESLEASYWHKFSGPLSALLMPLLGSVAAFGLVRSGALFVRAVLGMFLGFAYFVADNFGLAMGNLGAYPPLVAAWGPFVLFLLIGESVLIRSEE